MLAQLSFGSARAVSAFTAVSLVVLLSLTTATYSDEIVVTFGPEEGLNAGPVSSPGFYHKGITFTVDPWPDSPHSVMTPRILQQYTPYVPPLIAMPEGDTEGTSFTFASIIFSSQPTNITLTFDDPITDFGFLLGGQDCNGSGAPSLSVFVQDSGGSWLGNAVTPTAQDSGTSSGYWDVASSVSDWSGGQFETTSAVRIASESMGIFGATLSLENVSYTTDTSEEEPPAIVWHDLTWSGAASSDFSVGGNWTDDATAAPAENAPDKYTHLVLDDNLAAGAVHDPNGVAVVSLPEGTHEAQDMLVERYNYKVTGSGSLKLGEVGDDADGLRVGGGGSVQLDGVSADVSGQVYVGGLYDDQWTSYEGTLRLINGANLAVQQPHENTRHNGDAVEVGIGGALLIESGSKLVIGTTEPQEQQYLSCNNGLVRVVGAGSELSIIDATVFTGYVTGVNVSNGKVEVLSGGKMDAGDAYIDVSTSGNDVNNVSSLTVSGYGSLFNSTGQMRLISNYDGTAKVTVSNYAEANFGSVSLTSSSPRYSVNDRLALGMDVLSHATANFKYLSIRAEKDKSWSTLTVDGSGAKANVDGSLNVGATADRPGAAKVSLANGGSLTVTQPSGSYARTVIIEDGGTLEATDAFFRSEVSPTVDSGVVTLTRSAATIDSSGQWHDATHGLTVANLGTGRMDVTGDSTVNVDGTVCIGRQWGSDGTLSITGGTMTVDGTVYVGGDPFQNGGTGRLNVGGTGVLTADTIVNRDNGTISGDGTINADVVNYGTITPGNSPGQLIIQGRFENHGRLVLEISGNQPGEYDFLKVLGELVLDGELEIVIDDSALPNLSLGDEFTLFDCSTSSGAFQNVVLPQMSDGTPIMAMDDNGVATVTAVPEPTTLILLTAGALVMTRRRQKR